MSRRNDRQAKKIRKLAKALRRTPTAYIDLTEWLRDRRYASSRTKAEDILREGRVYVDSHPVGRTLVDNPFKKGEKQYVVTPYILAHHRGNITVREHGPS
jgi:hypothetical protein